MGGNNTRGYGQSDSGAALVEMALILPLLMLITIGIFTSARAWNVHNVLDHASREAARYGATNPSETEIENVAEGVVVSASFPWSSVNSCVDIGSGTLDCINPGNGDGQDPTTDERVQVALEIPDYELNFVFFTPTVTIRAQAVSRSEP